MSTKGLPKLAYGSVRLVSAGDGDPSHLSPLSAHALRTADAMIHDPTIPQKILYLVNPPGYREAAAPERAIERSIKLAQNGWRVVHLVEGNAMERAIKSAASFTQDNIPLHVAPDADEPLIGETQIGFLLVHKPQTAGRTETGALVVLIAVPPSIAAAEAERRQPPLSFSMSGLTG
jgi:siroheme synthase